MELDYLFQVRISSKMHKELKHIAKAKGMKLSDYSRLMLGLEIESRKLREERDAIWKKIESKELNDPVEIDRLFDDLLDKYGKYELTLGQYRLRFEGINTMRENAKIRAKELAS